MSCDGTSFAPNEPRVDVLVYLSHPLLTPWNFSTQKGPTADPCHFEGLRGLPGPPKASGLAGFGSGFGVFFGLRFCPLPARPEISAFSWPPPGEAWPVAPQHKVARFRNTNDKVNDSKGEGVGLLPQHLEVHYKLFRRA